MGRHEDEDRPVETPELLKAESARVGDVVRLRGHQTLMAVEYVAGANPGEAAVVWFDKNDQLHRASFRYDLLELRQRRTRLRWC